MKKILYIIFMIIIFNFSYSLNFTAAPVNFEVNLEKAITEEIYIINNTPEPLRIEAYIDTLKGYEDKSLNSNIVIFPKKISIKPGEKQTIRFRIKPSENMESGKYKSLLVLQEIPSEIKKENSAETLKGVSAEFKLVTELAIVVTGIKK